MLSVVGILSTLPQEILINEILEKLPIPELLNFLLTNSILLQNLYPFFEKQIENYRYKLLSSRKESLLPFYSGQTISIPNSKVYLGFGLASNNPNAVCFKFPKSGQLKNLIVSTIPSVNFTATVYHQQADSKEFLPTSLIVKNGNPNLSNIIDIKKRDCIALEFLTSSAENIIINCTLTCLM